MNENRWNAAIIVAVGASLLLGCGGDDNPSFDGFLDLDAPADGTDSADGACTGTAPYCSADHTQVLMCNPATGGVTVVSTCGSAEACVGNTCATVACMPGTAECLDGENLQTCRSDGSGYDTMACPEGQRCNLEEDQCQVICSLRVFVLLDQSGSMSEGTPTKWDQAGEALQTLMLSPEAADVEFGFGSFPTDGDCGVDASMVQYPVPGATTSIVQDYFVDNGPNGNTPLAESMGFLVTDTSTNLRDPAYYNAILVVSDGVDTCYVDCLAACPNPFDFACMMNCEAESETLVAARLTATTVSLRALEIRTFVVGFGEGVSDTQLSAIADNGGTGFAWIQAGNVDELSAAFETILAEMWECNPIMI